MRQEDAVVYKLVGPVSCLHKPMTQPDPMKGLDVIQCVYVTPRRQVEVMVKQNIDDAKVSTFQYFTSAFFLSLCEGNVGKRLDYISGELERRGVRAFDFFCKKVEQDHFREGERAWREAKALDQVPASLTSCFSFAQDAAGVTG